MTANDDRAAEAPGWVWSQQSVWSQAANRLRRNLMRWRVVILGLSVTAAVSVTLAAEVANLSTAAGRALAWAGAAASGLIVPFSGWIGRDSIERWTRARSAAETMKAEMYQYLAGVAPYRGADPAGKLKRRADDILAAVDDLSDVSSVFSRNAGPCLV